MSVQGAGSISRSKHARFVLTTREHILQHALQISEHFRREGGFLADHRCILELGGYTLLDRGRILYNHIYFGDLAADYKAELLKDEFYMGILKHRNFNPRLVEWLSRYTNVKQVPPANYRKEVERVLENPSELWRIAFEQQISEASRSLLLALYSLGGTAHLDRLQEAWKELHRHRAKKYNWESTAEDWRRSLQDLEGGFLLFKDRQVTFVNPSVKDFFDSTLANDTEHLDDVVSASCFFEQIVSIWSLAGSEKGAAVQRVFQKSPELLMGAVTKILQNPHEEKVELGRGVYGTRERDVRPEVRLRTMVLIADDTRSESALECAETYSRTVAEFWVGNVPDFQAAMDVLRALDLVRWHRLKRLDLYQQLKTSIMNEVNERGRSGGIFAVADYAEGKGSRWSDGDQRALVESFETYLEGDFDEEFTDRDSDPGDLQTFSDTLRSIAKWCHVPVGGHLDQIAERIAELTETPDEDDRPVRQWEGATQSIEPKTEEAEVRRLFDGLRYV